MRLSYTGVTYTLLVYSTFTFSTNGEKQSKRDPHLLKTQATENDQSVVKDTSINPYILIAAPPGYKVFQVPGSRNILVRPEKNNKKIHEESLVVPTARVESNPISQPHKSNVDTNNSKETFMETQMFKGSVQSEVPNTVTQHEVDERHTAIYNNAIQKSVNQETRFISPDYLRDPVYVLPPQRPFASDQHRDMPFQNTYNGILTPEKTQNMDLQTPFYTSLVQQSHIDPVVVDIQATPTLHYHAENKENIQDKLSQNPPESSQVQDGFFIKTKTVNPVDGVYSNDNSFRVVMVDATKPIQQLKSSIASDDSQNSATSVIPSYLIQRRDNVVSRKPIKQFIVPYMQDDAVNYFINKIGSRPIILPGYLYSIYHTDYTNYDGSRDSTIYNQISSVRQQKPSFFYDNSESSYDNYESYGLSTEQDNFLAENSYATLTKKTNVFEKLKDSSQELEGGLANNPIIVLSDEENGNVVT